MVDTLRGAAVRMLEPAVVHLQVAGVLVQVSQAGALIQLVVIRVCDCRLTGLDLLHSNRACRDELGCSRFCFPTGSYRGAPKQAVLTLSCNGRASSQSWHLVTLAVFWSGGCRSVIV